MSFCTKCGAQLNPGDRFCAKCGAPVANQENKQPQDTGEPDNMEPQQSQGTEKSDNEENRQPQDIGTPDNVKTEQPQNENKHEDMDVSQTNPYIGQNNGPQSGPVGSGTAAVPKRKIDTSIILAIVIIVVAVVGIAGGIFIHKKCYNLKKYCKVKVGGYEDYGTVSVWLDSEKLDNEMEKRAGIKDIDDYKSMYDLGSDLRKGVQIEDFVESIDVHKQKDKNGEYSNGDKVKVKITYNKSKARKLGYIIYGDSMTVRVKGLEKADVTDPFDGVTVTFNGALPWLEPVVHVPHGSGLSPSDFNIKADSDQLNYDGYPYLTRKNQEFTLVFKPRNDPEKGRVYGRRKKKFMVGKTSTYIRKASELSDDDRKQLIGFAMKEIKEKDDSLKNIKFLGLCVSCQNTPPTMVDYYPERVTLFFSHNADDLWMFEDDLEYMYVNIHDVMRQTDGSLYFSEDSDSEVVDNNYNIKEVIDGNVAEYYDTDYDKQVHKAFNDFIKYTGIVD